MKQNKIYAYGKHAVAEATRHAPHAVLKVFTNEKEGEVARISVHALVQQYEKFMSTLRPTPDTVLVLLSGVEDPHNFGAIIRSAAGFGASAVLMPQKGQAPLSGAVLKVSAGMAFRIPLVTIADIPKTVADLKKRGFKVHALAAGAKTIADEPFAEPAVLILGNEGTGVPKTIRALVDQTLSIPMHPRTESLNVAAAAAAALFAWSTRHPAALS